MKRVLLAFVFVFPCLGCPVTSERFIAGTYRAEAPCGTITLVVNRDHSFVQSVQMKSGDANQLSGKWHVERNYRTVRFEPFLDFLDDTRGRQQRERGFSADVMPRGISMGPIIVKCPDSSHEIDYVK
jgi:hypothetical protein